MDIRNWFQPKGKKTIDTKKRRIEDDDDDDDVIPGSPDVQIVSKKKKQSNDVHTSKSKHKSNSNKQLKEVKATDLFGNGSIKRTEPIVKTGTKKTETGIHSDDEFEKSLLEIDDLDKLVSNGATKNQHLQKSPQKPKNLESSSKSVENHNKLEKPLSKLNKPSTSKDHKANLASQKVDKIKKEIKENNKRKFTEFFDGGQEKTEENNIEPNELNTDDKTENTKFTNDDSVLEEHDDFKSKKRRLNKSLNESVLTDEERHERKIHSARLYQSYLNRSGPKHLGTKEMPEGAPNCLKDFAILLTGVLDSFEREEIVETISKYGGCIKNSISKKVTHVLAGEEAGPAKMAKAEELGIVILNEDDFLKIIADSNKPKQTSESNKEHKKEKDHNRKSSKDHKKMKKESEKELKKSPKNKHEKKLSKDNSEGSEIKKEKMEHRHSKENEKKSKSERTRQENPKTELKVEDKCYPKSNSPTKVDVVKLEKTVVKSETLSKVITNPKKVAEANSADVNRTSSEKSIDIQTSGTMWVEKYKPQNVKQIIGQLGDGSNVNKLINWLTKWYVNRKAKLPKPSPWAKNDDGGFYKAALLSGPPGVGKTTTVALVCKQLGFDMVEFNASDTRNKTLIKEQIGELLTSTSLSAYAKGATGKQAVTKKHVLVMDEVDGMAGNEDRGGLQELIGLIKSTSVPIICMCNDRNSQKMRSLVNYCYDLRFNRPRVDQIKAAMRSICCKENIKIPPDVLGQLIVSANQDVRQTLNLLSMWAIDPSLMDPDKLSKDASVAKKDVKLGPWEAIRKVFSAEEHKTMSINDKSDLFFYDYSLAPLFVQENYLQVQPHCPKNEILHRISQAADSIAFGDTIEKRIRSSQAWSLLPMQAMYSSVLPGHYLSGHVAGQVQFPGWLGKNSRANKMQRLAQEIHAHTRLSTTGSKSSIFLDYSSHLRDAIINPLIKERSDGIEQSLAVLEAYNLLREDLESLTELSVWPGQRNPTVLIDSKVKAAMTRTYNKKASALPYAPGAIKRGRTRDEEGGDEGEGDDDQQEADEEQDSDPENDALIKKKKNQPQKSSSSSDKPSTSKGSSSKGTGKGKKK